MWKQSQARLNKGKDVDLSIFSLSSVRYFPSSVLPNACSLQSATLLNREKWTKMHGPNQAAGVVNIEVEQDSIVVTYGNGLSR